MIRVTPIMRAALVETARVYARTARVPLRVVSRRAYGDSRFFSTMTKGAAFTAAKYDDVMAFFADPKNWPEGRFPDHLPDPFAALEKSRESRRTTRPEHRPRQPAAP